MNKASGSDGIPPELFQIPKDDVVKVLHSVFQHIWKTRQWPQVWKRSVFILIPKKGNAKNIQTTERVTGRKARGHQTEEIGCKCQAFFTSPLSGRRKQTTGVNFFSFSMQN